VAKLKRVEVEKRKRQLEMVEQMREGTWPPPSKRGMVVVVL